jgi:hypothetical protein
MWNFTVFVFRLMEKKKTAPAWRRILALAYAQPGKDKYGHPQESLPGPLFDATVFGLFLIAGIAYFV